MLGFGHLRTTQNFVSSILDGSKYNEICIHNYILINTIVVDYFSYL